MITTLLIIHALLSVALLGAVTHQLASVWRPEPRLASGSFVASFRNVRAVSYADAITGPYALTAVLGWVVYPPYKLHVQPVLLSTGHHPENDLFEIKEHVSAIGLFMLPAYRLYWNRPLVPDGVATRRLLTSIIAAIVWWNFLVGHILNNIKGFG